MDGALQLVYTAGKLLCPKQSLLPEEEMPETLQQSASSAAADTLEQQPVTNRVAARPRRALESPSTVGAKEGAQRVGSRGGSEKRGPSSTAGGCAAASGGGSEGGFGGLVYMLRSLSSPMQVWYSYVPCSRRAVPPRLKWEGEHRTGSLPCLYCLVGGWLVGS